MAAAGAWLAWNHHRQGGEPGTPLLTLNQGSEWQKRAPAPARKITVNTVQRPAIPESGAAAAGEAAAPAGAAAANEPGAAPAESPAAGASNAPPPSPTPDVAALEGYYAGLFRRLNLTADQVAQFKGFRDSAALDALNALPPGVREQLDSNPAAVRQMIAATEANLDAQVQAQFGDALYAQYKLDQQTFSQRVTVDQLEQSLRTGPSPLTDEQANQLVQILARTEAPGPKTLYSRITPDAVNQAATVLTQEQLLALQQLQQQQQQAGGN